MPVSQKVRTRIIAELKPFIHVVEEARKRDVSESDTVVIIGDMIAAIMGYRKYTEITTEFAIRGTFVDLAVKIESDVRFLVEAKAVNVDLKESHIKQAVDYGANQGIEWVVLTNAARWMVFRIGFGQPISATLVLDIDIVAVGHRNEEAITLFGNLSREEFTKSGMQQVFMNRQATSPYALAALLMAPDQLSYLRRELRRLNPGLRIEDDEIARVLKQDVLKRELVDSEDATKAATALRKLQQSAERRKAAAAKSKDAAAASSDGAESETLTEAGN
jgi:hypothetical protein